MKRFAQLYDELDESTRTNDKVRALVAYFKEVPPQDAAWAVALLTGKRPKRPVNSTRMKEWAAEAAGIPVWLFDESYLTVGDLSETLSLINDGASRENPPALQTIMETELLLLTRMDEGSQKDYIQNFWKKNDQPIRFLFNKLIGGSFRVGVSQQLVIKALSSFSGVPETALTYRLTGNWTPSAETYHSWFNEQIDNDPSKPYPFCLAYALDVPFDELGPASTWYAEWKWDGIRSQLIKRESKVYIWSRGEELVTHRYPELEIAGMNLPDGTVIDGELIGWKDHKPLPFADLQKRIGRKTTGKKLLTEVPVAIVAYDLLEYKGVDIRNQSYIQRRGLLEQSIRECGNSDHLAISPVYTFDEWEQYIQLRNRSRDYKAEGLMLKKGSSVYKSGRKRGDWWKWKVDPFTIDAVLIYAQRGTGRRAGLYTDYTFGIWDGEKLVTIAKAYSGLTDAEIKEVDLFVKNNTLETFGPVRTVKAELVFELAFEGIQLSTRHKSGIAVRFPRISRWRHDKKPADADTLELVKELLKNI